MSVSIVICRCFAFRGILLLIAVLLVLISEGKTHPPKADELHGLLVTLDPQEDSVGILNSLSAQLRSSNLPEAKRYARRAIKYAKNVGNEEGLATAHNTLGIAFFYEGLELDSAIHHYETCHDLLMRLGDTLGALGAQNNIAIAYRIRGDFKRAIGVFEEILTKSEQLKDINGVAKYNNNIGNAYENMGDYSAALKCYKESQRIYKQMGNENEVRVSDFNIANVYDQMGRYDDALRLRREYLQFCLEKGDKKGVSTAYHNIGSNHFKMENYDSAAYYYQKSLLIKQEIKDYAGLATTYDDLTAVFVKSKSQYDSAFAYVERSMQIHEQGKDSVGLANAYIRLGSIQMNTGAYDKAIESFLSADELLKNFESPTHKLEILRKLLSAYEFSSEPAKALEYSHQLRVLEDTMNSRISAAYRQEIALNEARHRAAVLSLSVKQRNFVIAGLSIGFLLVIGLLIAIVHGNRQRRGRMEEEQRRLKAEQIGLKRKHEIDKLLKDQELKSIGQVLEVQEQERKRIAQDLHDRLGSMLSMVKVHFLNTEDNISNLQERNQQEYERAISLLDEACEEVRRISHNLVSGVLKNFGLSAALEELKDALQNIGKLEVDLILHNMDDRLNYDSEVNVYRIIQECVNNILRHANATYISIQVIRDANGLKAMVEDNGVGFEPDSLNGSKGIGLKNIESRVVRLNGKFKVDSTPGKGTTIIVTTPIPQLHDTGSDSR